MSYIDALYLREKDQILVSERDKNGNRITKTFPVVHRAYYEDKKGCYESIFGDKLSKIETNTYQKFQKEIHQKTQGKKLFESDINPIFRLLEEHYLGKDGPELNICFLDIETDFDSAKGFATPWNCFSAVTAITIYNTFIGKPITLVLRPKQINKKTGKEYVSIEQANEIVEKFEDTILFEKEEDLLDSFLMLIEDVDVITGWNCLAKTENVWLKDRILPLSAIKEKSKTLDFGSVIKYHDSGLKKANKITLYNGAEIICSDEHVIPYIMSSLKSSLTENSVGEIKKIFNEGKQIFFEYKINKNNNKDYTYRDFIVENLDELMAMPDFGIAIEKKELREKVKNHLKEINEFEKYFNFSRAYTSFRDYPKMWSSNKFSFITKEDLLLQINENNNITFTFNGNLKFNIILDKNIENDVLQTLGMIFTDGSYYKKGKNFTIYNTDLKSLEYYKNTTNIFTNPKRTSIKPIVRSKDGCASLDFKKGSVFGLLMPMIYNNHFKKTINTKILSRLSTKQFSAFVSGLIDGDGCITKHSIDICNFDNMTRNIQELMSWNGVHTTRRKNNICINGIELNGEFIKSLNITNIKRKEKIEKIILTKRNNSPNKKLRRFFDDNKVFLKVKSIEELNSNVEMADIETENHYFYCSGIKVHNSGGYDIPYLVNRVEQLMGKEATKRFCLWDQKPRIKKYEKFGKEQKTYDLVGRVHLDYLELFMKHTPQQLHSYRLDYVGEVVVGEKKVQYDGTFEQLYNEDFEIFISYNRQDVMLLVKIDEKKKYIDLCNQIAHANAVLFKTTTGSVVLIEQAITLEAHSKNLIVPNRKEEYDVELLESKVDDVDDDEEEEEDTAAVGAYVATPRTGLHDYIGAVDINSLYPSTIRSLNISTETLFGQIRLDITHAELDRRAKQGIKKKDLWEGIFTSLEYDAVINQTDEMLTLDLESGETFELSGKEIYDLVFAENSNLVISANGTLFTRHKNGIIGSLLERWYAERKAMQGKAKNFKEMEEGILIKDEELLKLLKN